MVDVRCTSVLGHDDAVHALNGDGYCLCGMGRKQLRLDQDLRDIYGDKPVNCLECLARQGRSDREGVVWLHYENI